MKKNIYILILGSFIFASGCSTVTDIPRKIWGSSTMTLERERVNATSQSFKCEFDACFDAILSLARNEKDLKPLHKKVFDVFIKDRIKSHIIVLGIEGNIDTTEVGIFFSRVAQDYYRIDVSSLSSSAKEKVAKAVFTELTARFSE